jgi:pyrroloquinoline quinone biosynthesis protein B
MRLIVLGAAAGGGLPQWNCACPLCRRARAGDPAVPPRTQSSLAVSADGDRWLLLNAAPDLRQQIQATPALHPTTAPRGSPIAAVLATNGDVDHSGGLINLREGHAFALYASAALHATLDANPMLEVLGRRTVPRRTLALETPTPLHDAAGAALGLTVETFAVPGKVPLYLETTHTKGDQAGAAGDTVGVRLRAEASGAEAFYVPNCAQLDAPLRRRLAGADLVLFDGTLYRDDELIAQGLGRKTGRRMGHIPIAGDGGSLDGFRDLAVARKVYVHMNNSNPVLAADTAERAEVAAAGWEVAHDGLEIRLDGAAP